MKLLSGILIPIVWLASALTHAEDIVIDRVNVIDAVDGLRTNQRVVVRDGVIHSVTDASAETAPGGSIDGSGRFLMPGLWDMHVHFVYDERLIDVMPELFLDYGITSVRDTGGDIDRLTDFRRRVVASDTPAPSIYLSGPLMDGEHVVYDGGDAGRPPLGTRVATAEEAVRKVRQFKEMGADFIKIYEMVSPRVYEALIASANLHDLPVASHVPLSLTADTAGPLAGSMEHLRNVELACAGNWQELLDERRRQLSDFEGRGYDLRSALHTLQRIPAISAYDDARCRKVLSTLTDTIQVPTLRLNTMSVAQPFLRQNWIETLPRLPDDVQKDWQAAADRIAGAENDSTFTDWSFFLVGLMHELGVPVGAGTDTPIGLGIPGESLHNELALLVQSGLSNREALYAATVQPANFLRMESRIGRIQPGMAADLILLSANPLIDINNTRRIERVMKNGRWVR